MTKKLNIAMAGGGSWWHTFPIQRLIKFLDVKPDLAQNVNHVYRLGTRKSLEAETCLSLTDNSTIPITFVSILSGKVRRQKTLKALFQNIWDFFLFIIAIVQSLVLLKKYHIDVIFCKWWYVALPVVIAAKLLKMKIIVHESDTHPGLVNRIAARRATKTFTGFENTLPLSETIWQILSDDLLPPFNTKLNQITKDMNIQKTRILVLWWSLGAKTIYQWLAKIFDKEKKLLDDFEVFIVWGILNKNISTLFPHQKNIHLFDFLTQSQMWFLCSQCDLCLTRGGTTSLAEQKLRNIKLLIVPLPWTHDQLDNAKYYKKNYNDEILLQNTNFETTLKEKLQKFRKYKKQAHSQPQLATIHSPKSKIRKAILG